MLRLQECVNCKKKQRFIVCCLLDNGNIAYREVVWIIYLFTKDF